MPKTNGAAQSDRCLSGQSLEENVIYILNESLVPHGIHAVRGNRRSLEELTGDKTIAHQVIDYLRLPVKRSCTQEQLTDYPDADILIIAKEHSSWRVLGVISAKTSFHSRHTMVCFWGLVLRICSHIKYVCVTLDKDAAKGRSELGVSCRKSTATRRLLESFTDGIYIIKDYGSGRRLDRDINDSSSGNGVGPFFDNPVSSNHTKYCRSVRPFDDLIKEIKRWRQ